MRKSVSGVLPRLWTVLATVLVLLAVVAGSAWSLAPSEHEAPGSLPTVSISQLPPEARQVVQLVRRGGPFAYDRDGTSFGNRERLLPLRERGYYREYTVPTPGLSHRGARRIVAGRAGELYYTQDHYRSFRRIRE